MEEEPRYSLGSSDPYAVRSKAAEGVKEKKCLGNEEQVERVKTACERAFEFLNDNKKKILHGTLLVGVVTIGLWTRELNIILPILALLLTYGIWGAYDTFVRHKRIKEMQKDEGTITPALAALVKEIERIKVTFDEENKAALDKGDVDLAAQTLVDAHKRLQTAFEGIPELMKKYKRASFASSLNSTIRSIKVDVDGIEAWKSKPNNDSIEHINEIEARKGVLLSRFISLKKVVTTASDGFRRYQEAATRN